jgi:hypothetical protein
VTPRHEDRPIHAHLSGPTVAWAFCALSSLCTRFATQNNRDLLHRSNRRSLPRGGTRLRTGEGCVLTAQRRSVTNRPGGHARGALSGPAELENCWLVCFNHDNFHGTTFYSSHRLLAPNRLSRALRKLVRTSVTLPFGCLCAACCSRLSERYNTLTPIPVPIAYVYHWPL